MSPPEVIQEGSSFDRASLGARFTPQVLDRFLELGVLSPGGAGKLRASFVGIAAVGGRTFQFAPKAFSLKQAYDAEAMRHVVRALRRYARWKPSHHEDAPHLRIDPQAAALSAIAVADALVRDYLALGIYRRTVTNRRLNGAGPIAWQATVDRISPVFSGGRPVYLDALTSASDNDAQNFISRLHKTALEESLTVYGPLLGYAPFSLSQEPYEAFRERPSEGMGRRYIDSEMRQAFSDRSLALLPLLLTWLEASSMKARDDLALYGTASFHNVWESACSAALGNQREDWQAAIPQPRWVASDGQSALAQTFIPDIVLGGSDPGDHLIIVDAKYYKLQMPPGLRDAPGVNDVAKQLWYEEALVPEARRRGYSRVTNVFAMPGGENSTGFWNDGYVEFSGVNGSQIGVTRLDCLRTLRLYADRQPLDAGLASSVLGKAPHRAIPTL